MIIGITGRIGAGKETLIQFLVDQGFEYIVTSKILSEELEVARNLPYEDVGILNGVPAGVISQTKTVSRNNVDFNLTATVRNIDHPFDGTIGGNPNDTSPADYKLV